MCINCDLFSMIHDTNGAETFPATLMMSVMMGAANLRKIKEAALKEIKTDVMVLFCDPLFFYDMARMRMMVISQPDGFKNAGLKNDKLELLTEEYFNTLKNTDFLLVHYDHHVPNMDVEQKMKLVADGNIMTCNVQRPAGYEESCFQGCIVPEDGPKLVMEITDFIEKHKSELISFYRLVKSRCGADTLLFLRCIVQELSDYCIRSIDNIDWIKECINHLNDGCGKDIDYYLEQFKTSPCYHGTRSYLKHTHGASDSDVVVKTIQ